MEESARGLIIDGTPSCEIYGRWRSRSTLLACQSRANISKEWANFRIQGIKIKNAVKDWKLYFDGWSCLPTLRDRYFILGLTRICSLAWWNLGHLGQLDRTKRMGIGDPPKWPMRPSWWRTKNVYVVAMDEKVSEEKHDLRDVVAMTRWSISMFVEEKSDRWRMLSLWSMFVEEKSGRWRMLSLWPGGLAGRDTVQFPFVMICCLAAKSDDRLEKGNQRRRRSGLHFS